MFEFIDNNEVLFHFKLYHNHKCINLIAPYYEANDLEAGCDVLMQEANKRWK